MTSREIMSLTDQYILHTYGRFPVAIDHGEGATLYDPEGNAYIDFTSGIGVSDLGYGNQPWADAIAAQAKKLGHVSNLFYTEPPARLAEILCRRTGMSGVFFARIMQGTREEIFSALEGVPVLAADMGGQNAFSFQPPEKFCLAIGSEGNGLSQETRTRADFTVRIPMDARCESLNAAVSAGILMYALRREEN